MAKYQRLATTIAAHYRAVQGATDAFYLDGRMSRAGQYTNRDITLDRTDEGFYFAIFASTELGADSERTYQQKKRSLDRIAELIKDESRGNIDQAINDMAENAVHMAGRLSISDPSVRHPYYAGILVREGEMAAVTMSTGLAYLYRNDALFPLTQDDFPMEAVDQAGKPVDNFDIYGAGKAGTIRYSNISQIQVDDCIILCTREVMETIGQQGMLDLLDASYDQQEAAEAVADLMARDAAGVPFQFMMSFVEEIILPTRRGRAKDQTGMHRAISDAPISETAMTDQTTRFDPKTISPYSAAAAGLVKPSEPESPGLGEVIHSGESAKAAIQESTDRTGDDSFAGRSQRRSGDVGATTAAEAAAEEAEAEEAVLAEAAVTGASVADVVADGTSRGDDFSDTADWSDQRDASAAWSRQREDEAALAEEASAEYYDGTSGLQDESAARTAASSTPSMTAAASLHRDLPDDGEWEEERPVHRPSRNNNGRILLTILVILLLALIFIGVAYLLNRDRQGSQTTTPENTTTVEETTPPTETTLPAETTPPTTEPTVAETTTPSTSFGEAVMLEGENGGTYPSVYHVQLGDSFYSIFDEVYADYDLSSLDFATVNELIGLFVEANPDTITGTVEDNDVMIYADSIINVPDPSSILDVR